MLLLPVLVFLTTSSSLLCVWHTLLQEKLLTPVSKTTKQPTPKTNAVKNFLFRNILHYLNKKLTWKQAVPTENPFPIWSLYNRGFPCQDLFLPKRTWLFFPCSIAAKNTMGNYAAVQPAVILFFQAGALLCSYSWKFPPVLLLCPMFFFWYQFYTVCVKNT